MGEYRDWQDVLEAEAVAPAARRVVDVPTARPAWRPDAAPTPTALPALPPGVTLPPRLVELLAEKDRLERQLRALLGEAGADPDAARKARAFPPASRERRPRRRPRPDVQAQRPSLLVHAPLRRAGEEVSSRAPLAGSPRTGVEVGASAGERLRVEFTTSPSERVTPSAEERARGGSRAPAERRAARARRGEEGSPRFGAQTEVPFTAEASRAESAAPRALSFVQGTDRAESRRMDVGFTAPQEREGAPRFTVGFTAAAERREDSTGRRGDEDRPRFGMTEEVGLAVPAERREESTGRREDGETPRFGMTEEVAFTRPAERREESTGRREDGETLRFGAGAEVAFTRPAERRGESTVRDEESAEQDEDTPRVGFTRPAEGRGESAARRGESEPPMAIGFTASAESRAEGAERAGRGASSAPLGSRPSEPRAVSEAPRRVEARLATTARAHAPPRESVAAERLTRSRPAPEAPRLGRPGAALERERRPSSSRRAGLELRGLGEPRRGGVARGEHLELDMDPPTARKRRGCDR